MTTLKEKAQAYEQKQFHNIADLPTVSTDCVIEERMGKDFETQEPKPYSVAVINGEDYRVPNGVLRDLKALIEAQLNVHKIKVIKSGMGKDTKYTVVPLE